MNRKHILQKNKNKGFTLVELIVVLVLLLILIGISIAGLLSWQDYSRFKKENSGAEMIYYAVQNQFTEWESAGTYDDKVLSVLNGMPGLNSYILGTPSNHGIFNGSTVLYEKNNYYSWEPGDSGTVIWAHTPPELSGATEKAKYQGSILYLSVDKGDYDKYKSGNITDPDKKLLFEIITTYISDKSILNGAITVEFSPEAAQVFSVSYSDRLDGFTYKEDADINLLDRTENTRRSNQIGYFAADSLSIPLKGRSHVLASNIRLINDEMLHLAISADGTTFSNSYTITLYRATSTQLNKTAPLMVFTLPSSNITATNPQDAAKSPQILEVAFMSGLYKGDTKAVPLAAWKETNSNTGLQEIHVLLDGADVQAQSYQYKEKENYFLNTYSFYRFGFDLAKEGDTAEKVNYVGCTVRSEGDSTDIETELQCSTFASHDQVSGREVFTIANGRHLYNVRFETDYKEGTDYRTFRLTDNVDWNAFTGKSGNNTRNYYFDSYLASSVNAGIGYDGLDATINRAYPALPDTKNYAFPGFRSLGINDLFTGDKNDGSNECYTISNLEIAYTANLKFGVYGKEAKIKWDGADVSNYGDYLTNAAGGERHPSHKDATKGLYPLGLFAENSGEITALTLNNHRVIGMEEIDDTPVFTNMVGGFVGDNLGKLSKLTLRNVANIEDEDTIENEGTTFVNGKTDVGGILGRQSWTLNDAEVVLDELNNYGNVTGMENVGGIIGRAYIIRDTFNDYAKSKRDYTFRIQHYEDGYDIFGAYSTTDGTYSPGNSITGKPVSRVTKITIQNCNNTGLIAGDALVHKGKMKPVWDSMITTLGGTAQGVKVADDTVQRCANIGGIAGITMDGYFYDYRALSNTYSDDSANKKWFASYIKNLTREMIVDHCSSYRLYQKNEIDNLLTSKNGNFADGEIKDRLTHDYYVGGLIGYCRFTEVSDCGNEYDDNGGRYTGYIFGKSYVGGLFGCFDFSVISRETKINDANGNPRYNIQNNVNVIGVSSVGGFAGGTGVGDDLQETLSFKHPAMNEGSLASQYCGTGHDDYRIEGILNTAVVLGMRKEVLGYAKTDGNLLREQEKAAVASNVYAPLLSAPADEEDAYIGGIAGNARGVAFQLDNIQSADTQKYALKLIGFGNVEPSAVTLAQVDSVRASSYYGGNGVGGIYGKVMDAGDINRDKVNQKKEYSVIKAVVYGQDAVGGYIGGAQGDIRETFIRNVIPDNTLVMGRNLVGGVLGVTRNQARLRNQKAPAHMNRPFTVYGNYAVGGVYGLLEYRGSISGESEEAYLDGGNERKIRIEGHAFVGGYVGIYESYGDRKAIGEVINVTVKADIFAGGVAGAVYRGNKSEQGSKTSPISIGGKDDTVSATYFAGGFAGLYAYSPATQDSDKNGDVTYRNRLFAAANDLLSVKNSPSDVISKIKSYETASDGIFGLYTETRTITLGNYPFSNNMIVEADLFAGGILGYMPAGQNFTLNGNNKQITTAVRTRATVGNNVLDTIASDSFGDRKYAYAGGVIGRIPSGMIVTNVSYNGIMNANGSYLGEIAEVNAGHVGNCTIRQFSAYNSNNTFMGGLVGLNKGSVGSDNKFANIDLIGNKILGGFIGENVTGITFNGFTVSDSNLKTLRVVNKNANETNSNNKSGTALALLVGYNRGTIDLKGIGETSATKISNTETVGVICGINAGTIHDSGVGAVKNGISENKEEKLRYEDLSSYAKNITLQAKDSTYAGLIAGSNTGSIIDLSLGSSSKISTVTKDYKYVYAGSIVGRNGTTGTVSTCYSSATISESGFSGNIEYAAGIAGYAQNASTIQHCDNYGTIYGGRFASGILAAVDGSSTGFAVNDCVNTGTLGGSMVINKVDTPAVKAGIVGDNKNLGNITLCRNYASVDYSMASSKVAQLIKCFEAGGLTSIGSAVDGIYTMDFFVSDTTDTLTPGSQTYPSETIRYSSSAKTMDMGLTNDDFTYEEGGEDKSAVAEYESRIKNEMDAMLGPDATNPNLYLNYVLAAYFGGSKMEMQAYLSKLYAAFIKNNYNDELYQANYPSASEFATYATSVLESGDLTGSAETYTSVEVKVSTKIGSLVFDSADTEYIPAGSTDKVKEKFLAGDYIELETVDSWFDSTDASAKLPLVYLYNANYAGDKTGFETYLANLYATYWSKKSLTTKPADSDFLVFALEVTEKGEIPAGPIATGWPLQLKVYNDGAKYNLVYLKDGEYHIAISDLSSNPLDVTNAKEKFELLDAKVFEMMKSDPGEFVN